ncbi:MAG: endonuclease/exonuclease/phosphatase family protein [Candidatus Paceibacterota bacterium]
MLFSNRELDRAFSFIRDADFDIFCLQEVPENFLSRLKSLPFHIAYCIDVEKITEPRIPMFNVILSRHPITTQGGIRFPEYWHHLPLRTRLFVLIMPDKKFSKIQNRGALYADISVGGKLLRILCLHLILAQPTWRLKEFELAMTKKDSAQPTIVCGDFNIIESPFIAPLNWLLGGSLSDALFYHRERTRIEESFSAHALSNPLRGQNTHAFAQSQLDHILVSPSFSIKHIEVIADRMGSDHHPVCIEVA